MTNSKGPARRSTAAPAGSGVSVNLRFAAYSPSLSPAMRQIIRNHGVIQASGRRKRVFLQGMERQLLPRRHEAGRNAEVLQRAAADRGDQQHFLPDAQGFDPGELGKVHAGE